MVLHVVLLWGMKSGKFNVRIPPSLHQYLEDRAKEEGISLNLLVTALLAAGSHYSLPALEKPLRGIG